MNKNKGVSRLAERAGWFVTLGTFFCGTIFLLAQQEANHQDQMATILSQSQSSIKNVQEKAPSLPRSPVRVSSKVLPPHGSNIGHAFWVSGQLNVMKTEVTKALYSSVMFGSAASEQPMLFTDVRDVFRFANSLSLEQGLTPCYVSDSLRKDCSGWRVPTNNEWMLFASAGQGTKYAGSDVFADVGWEDSQPYRVASKPPNSWGLYDMSGGARELVFDQKEKVYGLLGDTQPLANMDIQSLARSFSVRLVCVASKVSQRNEQTNSAYFDMK